ncbi:hypothetical protein ACFV1W_35085 [Kitasatospora sp. NPDC059648]|uniref:hypothetical protein n=1 Tax=Kitasatospora sp. NPDC059648 TaxID=3346894 RepID=UPI0036984722
MTGVLIAAIGSTIAVLALPEIQHDLAISLTSVTWVVAYLPVVTVLSAIRGRPVADRPSARTG